MMLGAKTVAVRRQMGGMLMLIEHNSPLALPKVVCNPVSITRYSINLRRRRLIISE